MQRSLVPIHDKGSIFCGGAMVWSTASLAGMESHCSNAMHALWPCKVMFELSELRGMPTDATPTRRCSLQQVSTTLAFLL